MYSPNAWHIAWLNKRYQQFIAAAAVAINSRSSSFLSSYSTNIGQLTKTYSLFPLYSFIQAAERVIIQSVHSDILAIYHFIY